METICEIPTWQLKKVKTKSEVNADIMTKGHFTRDEWNNLLWLFNIHLFSSLCCVKNFSLISCTERMAKRMQGQSEENRIVAKSRPTAMNLTSSVPTCSSSVNSPNASKKPGSTQSFKSTGWIIREAWCKHPSKFQSRRSVEFSRMAMGCSTVHQHRETCANGQGSEVSESAGKSDISTGALVATEHQGCSGNPEVPEDSEGSELESRIWPRHFPKITK